MFEVVFDYDESHYETLPLDPTRPELEQHRRVLASDVGGTKLVRPPGSVLFVSRPDSRCAPIAAAAAC